jgi:hypothetical protein
VHLQPNPSAEDAGEEVRLLGRQLGYRELAVVGALIQPDVETLDNVGEGGQVITGAAWGPYQFGVRHHKVKKDVGERESYRVFTFLNQLTTLPRY